MSEVRPIKPREGGRFVLAGTARFGKTRLRPSVIDQSLYLLSPGFSWGPRVHDAWVANSDTPHGQP